MKQYSFRAYSPQDFSYSRVRNSRQLILSNCSWIVFVDAGNDDDYLANWTIWIFWVCLKEASFCTVSDLTSRILVIEKYNFQCLYLANWRGCCIHWRLYRLFLFSRRTMRTMSATTQVVRWFDQHLVRSIDLTNTDGFNIYRIHDNFTTPASGC